MNQEVLKPIIDAITREVIERLNKRSKDECNPKKNLLLVFTGGTGNLDIVLSQLKALSHKYSFSAMFSPSAKKAFGEERVRQDIEIEEVPEEHFYSALNKADALVFPTLTQNTAAKAALGIRDSCACEALACGLLLKKSVIAVDDSIPIRSMPPAYGRMVGEILIKLEQLGVNLCSAKELKDQINKCCGNDVSQEDDTQIYEAPRLEEKGVEDIKVLSYAGKAPVTSEVIYNASMEGYGKILMAPKTLVTPMARDAAKEKNILLEWAVKRIADM